MLKKFGIPTLALIAILVLMTPTHASAAVRFGVAVGPVYAPPVYPYAYSYPYPYPDYYAYPGPYYYPGYAYPYGYYGGWYGYRNRGWRGHEFRERERREHGREGFRGGHRR